MAADEEVLDRLDRIIALLEVGFAQQIDRARSELRSDPVVAAVLELIADRWISSGELKRTVGQSVKVSEKTVQRSLAMLAGRGAIRGRGAGAGLSYRSAGIL
jgi:hypothetical protein